MQAGDGQRYKQGFKRDFLRFVAAFDTQTQDLPPSLWAVDCRDLVNLRPWALIAVNVRYHAIKG